MSDSLTLSLFKLPMPEEAEGLLDLPELPVLRHGEPGRRRTVKQAFWQPVLRKASFLPELDPPSVIRELVPQERMDSFDVAGRRHEQKMVEQPLPVSDALTEQSPQFTLRNLPRLEMDAWVDDLLWKREKLRDLPHELGLEDVRRMKLVPPLALLTEWALESVVGWQKEHRELLCELPWQTLRFRGGRAVSEAEKDKEKEKEKEEGE